MNQIKNFLLISIHFNKGLFKYYKYTCLTVKMNEINDSEDLDDRLLILESLVSELKLPNHSKPELEIVIFY